MKYIQPAKKSRLLSLSVSTQQTVYISQALDHLRFLPASIVQQTLQGVSITAFWHEESSQNMQFSLWGQTSPAHPNWCLPNPSQRFGQWGMWGRKVLPCDVLTGIRSASNTWTNTTVGITRGVPCLIILQEIMTGVTGDWYKQGGFWWLQYMYPTGLSTHNHVSGNTVRIVVWLETTSLVGLTGCILPCFLFLFSPSSLSPKPCAPSGKCLWSNSPEERIHRKRIIFIIFLWDKYHEVMT